MKTLRLIAATFTGRLACLMIRFFRLGYGSVFAGRIAKKIYPNIYRDLATQSKIVVYVTGTNGKTTTTRLLAHFLGKETTLYNASGANLESGLITALIKQCHFTRLKKEKIVFEVDERVLPDICAKKPPNILICLNLFRDQLDRYGEIHQIKTAWIKAMQKLPASTELIFNADDPALVFMAHQLPKAKVHYFGLNEPEKGSKTFFHAVDSIYCPNCHSPLEYQTIYLSHLGDYLCASCDFERKKPLMDSREYPSISPYLYNKYNTMSAVTAASFVGVAKSHLCEKILHFSPAFGRGEKIRVKGVEVLILLSKNSVSLNASLSIAKGLSDQGVLGGILLCLNDQEADGRDVSWIWDTEIGNITSISPNIFITGKRAHEMALCLTYSSKNNFCPQLLVNGDLPKLTKLALKKIPLGKTLCAIPTYTAMLELRETLLKKKVFS